MALSRHCWLAILACVVACTGCSSASSRVEVAGEVTIDAQPISDGTISLLPDQGHRGPAATTTIQSGRFQFSTVDGPLPGPHRAVVSLGNCEPSGQPAMTIDQASTIAKQAQETTELQPSVARPQAGAASATHTPPMPLRWETAVEIPASGTAGEGGLLQIRFQSPVTAQ